MHFASHGSRTGPASGNPVASANPSGESDAIPTGYPWWYGQTVGPVSHASNDVYSYFSYTPPVSPIAASGVDPKFWAQDGTGYGQFGWDPYQAGGSTWVGGFD